MAIDFLQIADSLQDELQQFFRIVRQTADAAARQAAAERLWAAVNRVEAFSYAPEEEQWKALSDSQRWGYLRLEPYVGTALRELRQLRHMAREGQENPLVFRRPREEARYA